MDIITINPIGGTNLRNSSSYPSKPFARKPKRDALEPDTVTLSQDAGNHEEDDTAGGDSY
jgi:hypothetical protein